MSHAATFAGDAVNSQAFALEAKALDGVERLVSRCREITHREAPAAPGDDAQHRLHALAWLATTAEVLRQLHGWSQRLAEKGRLGETEALIARIGFREYLAQIVGGIPMSQSEYARPGDFGMTAADVLAVLGQAAEALIAGGDTDKRRLAALIPAISDDLTDGDAGEDETIAQFRAEMRRFSKLEILPYAHRWHLEDRYIPMEVISDLREMGVFGLTIPEAHGGMGLGKESMCVVSEELSRGYIGVGSLGTRSEIAAELILAGGTTGQKAHWLPKIASGEVLPTAVFTEPNTGSDLASLRTRAVRDGDHWRITGQKTWITHAARADVMTLLARTNPDAPGYKGLSMFLAPKPRGDENNPFPVDGLKGSEIKVLGYRGMKEFELSFDGFQVAGDGLLGGVEGQGFKQLMQTFESARIQTAARAVGVAQSALDHALRYASDRIQFGKPIVAFPRVANKIAMMAVDVMAARQLTFFAARQKDLGRRCDLEAGMAKLFAARVAWAAADNAVQIHGGNGFALEFEVSRILCDARILNIFEGAAEIQAQVIGRRLLDGTN